jgi:hypothetical protein
MAYRVLHQPEFRTALAKAFPRGINREYLRGLMWTLEHDPHQGKKASDHVRIIKLLLAPVVVTFYYTIDEAKHLVHLIDVKV